MTTLLEEQEKAVNMSLEMGFLPIFGCETLSEYRERNRDCYGKVKVSRKIVQKYFGDIEKNSFWFPMEPTYWVTDMTLNRLRRDPKLVKAFID